MTAPVVILRPPDAGRAAALHAQCFERAWPETAFAGLFAEPGLIALGVEHGDDNLAGFVLARAIASEAEILTLAVDPQQRRRGLASGLLRALRSRLGERGVGALHLEVAEDNTGALRLYEQAGFEICGRRPGYYRREQGPPGDALLLRLDLGARAGLGRLRKA